MLRQCPSTALFCGVRGFTRHSAKRKMVNQSFQCKRVVEGQLVIDIVLDTGCPMVWVRSDLAGEKKFGEGETVTVEIAQAREHDNWSLFGGGSRFSCGGSGGQVYPLSGGCGTYGRIMTVAETVVVMVVPVAMAATTGL